VNLKPSLECAGCAAEVFVRVLENTKADEETKMRALVEALRVLADEMSKGTAPVDFSNRIFPILHEITKTPDPFIEVKRASNKAALSLLPNALREVESRPEGERLRTAALISVAGNELDVSTGSHVFSLDGLWGRVTETVDRGFAVDHSSLFSDEFGRCRSVLMIGDNAGEIALDIPLIRVMRSFGKRVYYLVRGGPVANDATMNDAKQVGLGEEVDAISTTGRSAFGVDLEELPADSGRLLQDSDVILSKGQSNYESLNWSKTDRPVYFLFKVKCRPISTTISKPVGSSVFMKKAG